MQCCLLVATFICNRPLHMRYADNEIVRKWEFDIRSICTVYPMSTIGFIGDSTSICSKNKPDAVKKE